MRKFVSVIVCTTLQLFISVAAHSQQSSTIDSLLQLLESTQTDSAKVMTLNTVSRALWQTSDFVKSREYAEEALRLASEINFGIGITVAYSNIGITYEYQGDFANALRCYSEVIMISEANADKLGVAHGHHESGNIHYHQGNYAKALQSFLTARRIYEEIGDREGISSMHITIGGIEFSQGNYVNARANFLEGLKFKEAIGDTSAMAGCHMNLAMVNMALDNYPEALKSNFAALEIMEKLGDRRNSASCYNNISVIYLSQGDYVNALKYSQASMQLAEEINDKKSILYAYLNLGKGYTGIKDYRAARTYLQEGLSLSAEIGSKDGMSEIYRSLSTLDSAAGDFKQSLANYKLFTLYTDSLLNETNTRQMEEIKTAYETEKKDAEIVLLTQSKEIQHARIKRQQLTQYYFIAGIAMLLLFTLMFYKNYRAKQLLKLQTLRNRIASDLHDDVGSTLSSIYIFSELAKEQSKEVIPALENISESSRKMLDAMADIVWTINPENDNFEKIIWRMRSFAYELLRAKDIEFEFAADEATTKMKLPMEVRKNVYLIFKEAIHNMVKYAGADKAFLAINSTSDRLTMLVRDNGKGFDVGQPTEGNGLRNMRMRAKEIGAELHIESGAGLGTTIHFSLVTT